MSLKKKFWRNINAPSAVSCYFFLKKAKVDYFIKYNPKVKKFSEKYPSWSGLPNKEKFYFLHYAMHHNISIFGVI